jgi:hypothetical protein
MEEPKVSMGSGGKIDEAGARGIADVDSDMSSSSSMDGSGLEGSRPESFESARRYVTTESYGRGAPGLDVGRNPKFAIFVFRL